MNLSEQNGKIVIKAALIAGILAFLVYVPALFYGFVNFDDPQYVYDNPALRVLDGKFFLEAFTTSYLGWWMPMVWISFALDYHIWGLNPFGYHLTNNLLHAINTGLVVLVADALFTGKTERRYYFTVLVMTALFWGVHPLRVESVAWVTERKDVLSGFFSLLTLRYYLRSATCQEGEAVVAWERRKSFLCAFLFFALSLMTKPLSVVLPLMFLVLDWYPLRRLETEKIQSLLIEKLPFFLLSLLTVVATLKFASGETILVSLGDHPLQNRLLVAGYAMGEYLRLLFWPSGLVHFYPIMAEYPASYYLNSLLFLAVTIYALASRKKYPFILASLALFTLPLLPVLGFFQNGDQSHANRFTYLSAVFPAIALGGVCMACLQSLALFRRSLLKFFPAGIFALLAASTLHTSRLISVWRNSETLWSRQIAVLPVGRAYYYRGDFLLRSGDYVRAAEDFAVAARMAAESGNPEVFNLHALRGDALYKAGLYAEAVAEFSTAIRMKPYANYFYYRGLSLQKIGRHVEAVADLHRAGDDRSPIEWMHGVAGRIDSGKKSLVPLTGEE